MPDFIERPFNRRDIVAVTAAQIGIAAALYTPLANLLPRKIAAIMGNGQASVGLAVVAGTGALVALCTNIVVGALADRSLATRGSRRRWAGLGTLVATLALIALARTNSLLAVTVAWALVQFGVNSTYCVVAAFIPDRVPAKDRGFMSAWFALGQTFGIVLGLGFVAVAAYAINVELIVLAFGYLVLSLPLLYIKNAARTSSPRRVSLYYALLTSFRNLTWDFRYAWAIRFIATTGNALAVIYLLYYIKDSLRLHNPSRVEVIAVLCAVVFTVCAAMIFGRASDRAGRRKSYVGAALIVMSVAYVVLATWRSLSGVLVSASILGLGYGIYLSVDQALMTEVLPDSSRYAQDLGVLNLANAGPQVFAPVLAAAVVSTSMGYAGLYLLVAMIMLVGLWPLKRIESVA